MHLKQSKSLQNGKYKIDKVLGQGGFGITYLATQELLDRKVCIKEFFFKDSCSRMPSGEVVLGTVGNKDLVERFLNKFIKEARTLSQFDHPNIIHVLDIFKENNTAYYVMDYIEGSSLEDIVRCKGALSEADAVNYIKQIADALNYIHQRNVNHLDVKPANIMIRKRDNKALLIDFGVSKQYDSCGDQTSTTPVGISYGYAPMEQYRPGGVGTFSPPADIYALGATLYKLVTGNVPPQAMEILNEGLTGLPQSLSSHIATAIKKAMQLRKMDRPQSIRDFLNILNVQNSSPKVSSYENSGQAANVQSAYSTNRSVKERVIKIIADKLGVDYNEVVMNASLQNDLGADSLDAVELIMDFEKEFDILIDDERIEEINKAKNFTVGDVIAYIENDSSRQSNELKHINTVYSQPKGFNQKSSSETTVIVPSNKKQEINGHEYVDLGLPSGIKWATCNIGANKPEEQGYHYAWGEIKPKARYNESNYEHIKLGKKVFNIFKSEVLLDNSIDYDKYDNIGLSISNCKYDAAKVNWGSSWRLPTSNECEELINKCKWSFTNKNGKAGYLITGPNGNSIFLPSNGWRIGSLLRDADSHGAYWSGTQGNGTTYAYCLWFNKSQHLTHLLERCHGKGIRPVSD